MRYYLLIAVFLALGLFACKNKKKPIDEDQFDKHAMLRNISENVIIKRYVELEEALTLLALKLDAFDASPTTSSLKAAQQATLSAYLAWQYCSVFEFGPAAEENLRLSMNTFPCDTNQIESNISTETYDLALAVNADAKGFPALDYLLFGNAENQTISSFSAAGKSRYTYASKVLTELQEKTAEVIYGWNEENYSVEFSNNTASNVGSPIGSLINQINFEFELLKNARIGIPMGKKTLGETQVLKLEAYYADRSKSMALANLQGIQEAFSGGSGQGFDDYLDALGAKRGNENLSTSILNRFSEVRMALESTDESYRDIIENNVSALEASYSAIEQLVVLLKTDLPSQLGVQITYQDNDGD